MDEEIKKRSENMVAMFKSAIGIQLKDLEQAPPFSRWLNAKLISAKKGELKVEFVVRQEMTNPTGLFHGGMQAALMDDLIGMTSLTLGYEGFMISIDLHVDFIGKAKAGDKVIATAVIERDGRSVIHTTAEILDIEGNTLSTANANLLKTTFKFL
jgi:uncharacterized protein (TIGR00369 family)